MVDNKEKISVIFGYPWIWVLYAKHNLFWCPGEHFHTLRTPSHPHSLGPVTCETVYLQHGSLHPHCFIKYHCNRKISIFFVAHYFTLNAKKKQLSNIIFLIIILCHVTTFLRFIFYISYVLFLEQQSVKLKGNLI